MLPFTNFDVPLGIFKFFVFCIFEITTLKVTHWDIKSSFITKNRSSSTVSCSVWVRSSFFFFLFRLFWIKVTLLSGHYSAYWANWRCSFSLDFFCRTFYCLYFSLLYMCFVYLYMYGGSIMLMLVWWIGSLLKWLFSCVVMVCCCCWVGCCCCLTTTHNKKKKHSQQYCMIVCLCLYLSPPPLQSDDFYTF